MPTISHREFLQIRLRQNNRARLFQSPHNVGIFIGKAIVEHRASAGGARSRRVDIVLQRDRIPCSGPRNVPAAASASSCLACASASSCISVMYALTFGL